MNRYALDTAIVPLNSRSCLISRRGKLVYEHYRDAQTAEEPARINSCTKSILSALIAKAMDQGLLPRADTLASEFFPQLAQDRDERKRDMTLQHLLTMTAGFNWTEFGGQHSFPRMTRSPHWVNFVLEQPMADAPGARMEYNSGVSQLLSAILVQASGMSIAHFAEKQLFGPLGMKPYRWEQDPQGIHTGGFGLWLRPIDMLKFGQLYLEEGSWKNDRLLSADTIARSVRPAIVVEAPRQGCYAWHWWTDSFAEPARNVLAQTPDYYYARGYGGQFIYVIPKLDTVVVLTADKQRTDKPLVDVFRQFIAPMLTERS